MNETPLARAWRFTYPWLATAVGVVLVILVVGLALGRARPRHDVPGVPVPVTPAVTSAAMAGPGVPSTPGPSPVPSASLGVTGSCRAAVDSLVVWALNGGTSPSHVPDVCAYLPRTQYETVWREETRAVAGESR